MIWGNHSSTQFPDVAHAYVVRDGQNTPVYDAVQDDAWIKEDFIKVHFEAHLLHEASFVVAQSFFMVCFVYLFPVTCTHTRTHTHTIQNEHTRTY